MQNTKPNQIVAALRRSREAKETPARAETVLDAAKRHPGFKERTSK